MRLRPRQPLSNVNISRSSPLRDFASMFAMVALAASLLYVLLGFAVDLVVPRISPAAEKRIASSLLLAHPLMKDSRPAPPDIQALAERTSKALGGMPLDLDVRVQRTNMINAFALPGGHIVITTGLLDALEYENELVFTLGHEMGHIQARDNLRGLGRGLLLLALSTTFNPGGDLNTTLSSLLDLTDRGFSRAQEKRADASGLAAVMGVYGHAGGIREFFGHLGGKDYNPLVELALTHPETPKRLAALEEAISSRQYPVQALTPLTRAE